MFSILFCICSCWDSIRVLKSLFDCWKIQKTYLQRIYISQNLAPETSTSRWIYSLHIFYVSRNILNFFYIFTHIKSLLVSLNGSSSGSHYSPLNPSLYLWSYTTSAQGLCSNRDSIYSRMCSWWSLGNIFLHPLFILGVL